MKRVLIVVLFGLQLLLSDPIHSQNMTERSKLFLRSVNKYEKGDLISADSILNVLLDVKDSLTSAQLRKVYTNLGAVATLLGNYNNALNFYNHAEDLIFDKNNNASDLADIYINKGIVFGIQKSFQQSLDYFEKGIRIYQSKNNTDMDIIYRISTSYLNIGIIYYKISEYNTALHYFRESMILKQKNSNREISAVYLNIAKSYLKLGKLPEAEIYFQKSIKSSIKESGEFHYRLAEIFFDYGLLLSSEGKIHEAIIVHNKALQICLINYGEKNTLVSLSYKHIADDYLKINKIDSSLYFYQKSLSADSPGFNNPDIFSNPSIDSSLFDIRLFDNLKSKAQALDIYATAQTDSAAKIRILHKSLETIDLALQLIDRIRNNYLSEESRVYLAENEKETYIFASYIACRVFQSTHDKSMAAKMYSFAQRAKSAILRNEITGNELLYSAGMPDSLREKQKALKSNIGAYNNLLLEEGRKPNPDSKKIALWKDALFEMNRENEKVNGEMDEVFPQYRKLIMRTEPESLVSIQQKLGHEESIVDYLLSNQYLNGKRKLYIFVITRTSIDFRVNLLDSAFAANAYMIRKSNNPSEKISDSNFKEYTDALHYMYTNLVKPVEKIIRGRKLIIIPDGEIAWLSFDSFLKSDLPAGQNDFEGLSYLLNDYTFSYGYSSSLLSGSNNRKMISPVVYAFSPDYAYSNSGTNSFKELRGSETEIASLFECFPGKEFRGERASKSNFLSLDHDNSILHLAMHSQVDSINSKFSCLIFDSQHSTVDENKLYNYEISLSRIKSPMIVLSACNSGTGTLYSSEGLMSLARSFILAGASSVIKTAWEINDETSSRIISRFYYYLSKGKSKDQAMRLSKIDYLKQASPAYINPYYWAAYEVMGDTRALVRNQQKLVIMLGIALLIFSGMAVYYFKRRRIFSERS